MKAWIVLGTLVLLAGCGAASHPMDPYMMDVLDAPDACYYVSLEDEPWATAAAFAGIKSNPGAADNKRLALAGVTPTANRIAAIECGFGDGTSQYLSAAIRFESAAEAKTWLGAVQEQGSTLLEGARCTPQAMVFDDGDVIGFIASLETWHPAFRQAADERFDAIVRSTGASDYCA